MKMIKTGLVAVTVVLGLCFAWCQKAEAREDDYYAAAKNECTGEGSSVFTMAILEDNPPFSWVTYKKRYDGEIVTPYGLGYYVLKEILEKAGMKRVLSYRADNLKKLKNIAMDRSDIMATIGIPYKPDLEPQIQRDFLMPAFASNPFVAVTINKKDGENVKADTVMDLYKLKVGILEKDKALGLFPSDLNLYGFKDTREGFIRLFNGELDALILSYYVADLDAEKYKIKGRVKIGTKPLRTSTIFLTLNKDNKCDILRDELSKELKALTADKVKMGQLLFKAYEDYRAQNVGFPPLIKE